MTSAEELCQRLAQLKGKRQNFDAQWQEVQDIVWPDGQPFTTQRSPGEKTNLQVYDPEPALALELGASVLETFLTPRTQRWHRLVPSNQELTKIARVKDWFEAATDVLFQFRNAARSKFSTAMHENWKSELAYGNGCVYVSEMPTGGTSYRYTHVGSTWIDVNADGDVDTVFHTYSLTAKAAVGRWKDKAPKRAQDAIAVNPYVEHQYLHCVYPNPAYEPGAMDNERMAFVAYEIAVEDKAILETNAYHELPYMWPRYTVNPAEVYGRGPAMLLLPAIKTLQEMQKTFLRSGQKVADPPLLVANDDQLGRGNRRINMGAGKLIHGGLDSQGRALIAPLVSGARLDVTLEMADQIRGLIRRAFNLDLFDILLQDRPDMTATEVLERAREKGQLTAPMVGRQQSELLGPMIHREIMIALRQGKLPQMPPELVEAQGDYQIEYESDATRMQKSSEVLAFPKTFEALGPLFEANPSLLAAWKPYESVQSVFEVSGGSTRLLNTEQEFAEIQKAQAAVEEEAADREAAPIAAKSVRDMAAARRDMGAAA